MVAPSFIFEPHTYSPLSSTAISVSLRTAGTPTKDILCLLLSLISLSFANHVILIGGVPGDLQASWVVSPFLTAGIALTFQQMWQVLWKEVIQRREKEAKDWGEPKDVKEILQTFHK